MIRPRAWVHSGSVVASGLLLHRPERALDLWQPGDGLRQTAHGVALLWPRTRRVDAAQALGAPLVLLHGRYCAGPFDADSLSALGAASGHLVVAHEGRLVDLGAGEGIEASDWLDLEGWAALDVEALGPPPPPPEAPPKAKASAVFAEAVGAPDPQVAELLQALVEAQDRDAAGASSGGRGPGLLLGLLAALLAPRAGRPALPSGGSGGGGAGVSAPPPRPRAPWLRRLDAWVAKRLAEKGLGRMVGKRHDAYLKEMMKRFESGDLAEALRHAIPLGGRGEGGGLAGFLLGPREIEMSPGSGAASVVPMGEDLVDRLKRMYEQSAKKLEAEGRLDEAAYVHAKLLDDPQGAVAMLERHEAWRLAAEVAEAWELPPEQAVRLWFLAGALDRAVDLARRAGCWSAALIMLSERDGEKAALFRATWAAFAASAGHYGGALKLIEPLGLDHLADVWLERALESGDEGPLLAKALSRWPERFDALRDRALERLADTSALGAPSRRRLAVALSAAESEPARRLLAPAVRALLRDLQLHGATEEGARIIRECARVVGGSLHADLPPLSVVTGRALRSAQPFEYRVSAADCGGVSLRAAALLPGGRFLLALGEAGVWVLSRGGGVQARLPAPAHDLVVSDTGTRALALARRGEGWRVSVLDLLHFGCSAPMELQLNAYARTYDGSSWVIAQGEQVHLLDLLQAGRSIWKVDVQHPVLGVSRDLDGFTLLVQEGGLTRWRYVFPSLALRARTELAVTQVAGRLPAIVFAPSTGQAEVFVEEGEGNAALVETRWTSVEQSVGRSTGVPWRSLGSAAWHQDLLALTQDDEVRLYRRSEHGLLARIVLEGGGEPAIRMSKEGLVICDRRGRLLWLDPEHGGLRADLRV